jgi:protein-S-isoprenylcysteine O-methyltransferase Ste14
VGFFDGFLLAILAGLAVAGVGRGVSLTRRGVRLLAIDRERTVLQGLNDLASVLLFLLWFWEAFTFAAGIDAHPTPAFLHGVVVDALPVRWLGAALMLAGLAVYVAGLGAFGDSWRLGIDREKPGALVTTGIFAFSRNPIYLALNLLLWGSFAIQGRAVLALLAAGVSALLHALILREERFLEAYYGAPYRTYRTHVPRYLKLRKGTVLRN